VRFYYLQNEQHNAGRVHIRLYDDTIFFGKRSLVKIVRAGVVFVALLFSLYRTNDILRCRFVVVFLLYHHSPPYILK